MKKIGLVTVLFNSPEVLPEFFESVVRQKYENFHLYVVDNSTNDDSFLLSKSLAEQHGMANISFIKNENNVGVAAANNQGIQLALDDSCDSVLILNNDIVFVDDDVFGRMVECGETEEIVVPKIYYHGADIIWCAGGELCKWTCVGKHYGENERDDGRYDSLTYVDYAPTCFMLVDRRVFESIGLMDEKYFVYYDDADFVYRANQAGYKLRYLPSVKIWHKVSSSTGGGESLFSVYYGSRNRMYFARKNMPSYVFAVVFLYFIFTRIIKFVFVYDAKQRQKAMSGFLDGLKLSIE